MKLLNLFMLTTLTLALFSFKSIEKNKIIGTWTVVDIDMSDMLIGISEEERELYEAFLPMFKEAFSSMVFTFNADGTMETSASMLGEETSSQGSWRLSDDGKTLITKNEEKQEEILIESLSDSEMVLNFIYDDVNIKLKMKKM